MAIKRLTGMDEEFEKECNARGEEFKSLEGLSNEEIYEKFGLDMENEYEPTLATAVGLYVCYVLGVPPKLIAAPIEEIASDENLTKELFDSLESMTKARVEFVAN